jgi:hypothetical protein
VLLLPLLPLLLLLLLLRSVLLSLLLSSFYPQLAAHGDAYHGMCPPALRHALDPKLLPQSRERELGCVRHRSSPNLDGSMSYDEYSSEEEGGYMDDGMLLARTHPSDSYPPEVHLLQPATLLHFSVLLVVNAHERITSRQARAVALLSVLLLMADGSRSREH